MAAETESLRAAVRRQEHAAACLFSVCTPFSENLNRWRDDQLPDKYDTNTFEVCGSLPGEGEIAAARDAQRQRGLSYLKLESGTPLPAAFTARCGFAESCTLTMVLTGGYGTWRRNGDVTVFELGEHPMEEDLLELERKVFGPVYGEDFTRRNLGRYLEVAGRKGPFRYFGAWEGDRFAGACYAVVRDGWAGLDGLVVDPACRNRYVATSLMAGILDRLGPVSAYLHADREDTPKDMYARMGFAPVDELYEYFTDL